MLVKYIKRRKIVSFFIFLLLVAFSIIAIGAGYESYSSKRIAPPGKRVDVGEHRLHIHKRGQGSPTVIFEAGSAESSLVWGQIPEQVADNATVVSYDRAGYGWSDKATTQRTGENIVKELHAALHSEGIHGPYILVAHSLGGLYSRLFAMEYSKEVSGLILLDPTPENFARETADIYKNEGVNPDDTGLPSNTLLTILKHTGALRIFKDTLLSHVPEKDRDITIDVELNGHYLETITQENQYISQTEDKLRGKSLGSVPVRIVTHGIPNDATKIGMSEESSNLLESIWQQQQKDTLKISTNSRLIVARNSGHMIMHEEPNLVLQIINELLSSGDRPK